MALIKCQTCNNNISSEAPACPNCGHPTKKKTSEAATHATIIVALLVLIGNIIVGTLNYSATMNIPFEEVFVEKRADAYADFIWLADRFQTEGYNFTNMTKMMEGAVTPSELLQTTSLCLAYSQTSEMQKMFTRFHRIISFGAKHGRLFNDGEGHDAMTCGIENCPFKMEDACTKNEYFYALNNLIRQIPNEYKKIDKINVAS